MKLESLAVHAGGRKPSAGFTAAATPIHVSSSYFYGTAAELAKVEAGNAEGYSYTRHGNPTADALHEQIAALEGGGAALSTASGMSALHLALSAALTGRPQRIVAANMLFGQTYLLLSGVMEPQGVETQFADPCDPDAFERAVAEHRPSCVLLEAVSNPLLRVAELDRIAAIAHEHGAALVADCTFTTPALLQARGLGADFIVHSGTKHLAGHADVLGGILVYASEHAPLVEDLSQTLGPNLGPFECYLTMRGIKTLPLRMAAHCRNAGIVARALQEDERILRVHYPGLADHPDHDAASRLFLPAAGGEKQYGGMVSFEIAGAGRQEVFRFLNALKLVVRTLSLGDVHSLVSYPAMSSHRNLSPKHRARLGIGDNLLRLSVGIEDPEDIVEDLLQALRG